MPTRRPHSLLCLSFGRMLRLLPLQRTPFLLPFTPLFVEDRAQPALGSLPDHARPPQPLQAGRGDFPGAPCVSGLITPGAPLHGSLGCHCTESSVDLPCVSRSLGAANNLHSLFLKASSACPRQLPFIQPQLRARRCVATVHPVFMSASNHPTKGGVGAPFPRGRVGAQQKEFAA